MEPEMVGEPTYRAGEGTIVVIQATDWRGSDAAIWEGLFPGAEVVATDARPGPNDGPQGGVAVIVPIKYEVFDRRTVVPGLCVEATVRQRDEPTGMAWVTQSLYLPPDDRQAASEANVSDNRRREGPV